MPIMDHKWVLRLVFSAMQVYPPAEVLPSMEKAYDSRTPW